MGVAALVLGIIAIVFSLFGLGIPVGIICGLVGIILGAVKRNQAPEDKIATAGLVCSIIGSIVSILGYIACAGCVGCLSALS